MPTVRFEPGTSLSEVQRVTPTPITLPRGSYYRLMNQSAPVGKDRTTSSIQMVVIVNIAWLETCRVRGPSAADAIVERLTKPEKLLFRMANKRLKRRQLKWWVSAVTFKDGDAEMWQGYRCWGGLSDIWMTGWCQSACLPLLIIPRLLFFFFSSSVSVSFCLATWSSVGLIISLRTEFAEYCFSFSSLYFTLWKPKTIDQYSFPLTQNIRNRKHSCCRRERCLFFSLICVWISSFLFARGCCC